MENTSSTDSAADSADKSNLYPQSTIHHPHPPSTWQPVTDRIVNSLWAELSATKVVNIRHVWQVIESDFVPEFNPFTFYLDRLVMGVPAILKGK